CTGHYGYDDGFAYW
nr:immunoglobulin heavy chain junction region [Mus musculus]